VRARARVCVCARALVIYFTMPSVLHAV